METIKIAHLYYDLMNLYGEHGNILALTKHLEAHKIKPIVHYLSLEDEIDFSKYDIFYIGSGNTPNFHLVRKDILKRKPIVRLSKNGDYISRFNTASEANRQGFKSGTVNRVLKGKQKYAYDSLWVYEDDYLSGNYII